MNWIQCNYLVLTCFVQLLLIFRTRCTRKCKLNVRPCPQVTVNLVLTLEGHMSLIHMQQGLIVVYFDQLLGAVRTRKLIKIHFFHFQAFFLLYNHFSSFYLWNTGLETLSYTPPPTLANPTPIPIWKKFGHPKCFGIVTFIQKELSKLVRIIHNCIHSSQFQN